MGKGTVGEKTIFLVLAVIFMGIALFVLFKYFPSLINSILMGLGVVKPTDLENAILCSIHRCVDGCMSMRVQELSWEENGKKVNCYEKFCAGIGGMLLSNNCECIEAAGILSGPGITPGEKICVPSTCKNKNRNLGISCTKKEDCESEIITDTNLKVCGNDYPVNITINKPQNVDISHLLITTASVSDVKGIMTSEEFDSWQKFRAAIGSFLLVFSPIIGSVYLGSTGDLNLLVVHNQAVTAYGDKIASDGVSVYKNIQIGLKGKPSTIIIATAQFPFPIGWTLTHVWAIPAS